MLLTGVRNGEPGVYAWSLECDPNGHIIFSGATQRPDRTAIGAGYHGALYFANAFHSSEMDTKQRT